MLPKNAMNSPIVRKLTFEARFTTISIYTIIIKCMRYIGNELDVSQNGNLNVLIIPHVKYKRNGNDNFPIHVANGQP